MSAEECCLSAHAELRFGGSSILHRGASSSSRKTRARGVRRHPSGRSSRRRRFRSINTPGLRACGYKTAPGRSNWPNRDPINELGFILLTTGQYVGRTDPNLYSFVGNNPINHIDLLGLATPEQIEEIKKEIELIQRMRELAEKMIQNMKNCKTQCLGVSTVVAHYCNCFRYYRDDCNNFADCICIQLVDDKACKRRALKACNIAKKIIDAYEKTQGGDD
jgi:hypothetical protein